MKYEFFRLTCPVHNPTHDGRCKYGLDAIKTFPAGTATFRGVTVDGRSYWRVFANGNYSTLYENSDLQSAIIEALEPSVPVTTAELFGIYDAIHYQPDVLDVLLQTGVITQSVLLDALEVALKKDQ